jgi:hypothetical protein
VSPERVRLEAVSLLNSRGGRDLARWVLGELRRGVVLEPKFIAAILIRLGAPEPVASVAASVVCLRAAAAITLDRIEYARTMAQALTPVAPAILGRLKRRERA